MASDILSSSISARDTKNQNQKDRQSSIGSHLKEADTANLLTLSELGLDLVQLLRHVSALAAEKLQRLLRALEVALGHQEDWRPEQRRG